MLELGKYTTKWNHDARYFHIAIVNWYACAIDVIIITQVSKIPKFGHEIQYKIYF